MISVSPLVRCPSCRYSLRGLPSAHQCPECGLEYDDRTIVFSPFQPWRPFVGEMVAMVFFTLFLFPNAIMALGRLASPGWRPFVWLLLYVWPVLTAIRIWLAYRRPNFIIANKHGLSVRVFQVLRRVEWRDIRYGKQAEHILARQTIRVLMKDGGRPLLVRGVLETESEAWSFCEIMGVIAGAPQDGPDVAMRWDAAWNRWREWAAGRVVKAPSNLSFYYSAAAFVLILTCIGLRVFAGTLISGQVIGVVVAIAVIAIPILILAGQWLSDPRAQIRKAEDEEVG